MADHADAIVIAAPIQVVFDTVADQRNEPLYNPAMLRSEKLTAGPIGLGTRFRATVGGRRGRRLELLIEYTAFDPPYLIESTTSAAAADVGYTLTFHPHPAGTVLGWSWWLRPRGAARLLGPAISWAGRRQERRIWTGLKRYVEQGIVAATRAGDVGRPGVAPPTSTTPARPVGAASAAARVACRVGARLRAGTGVACRVGARLRARTRTAHELVAGGAAVAGAVVTAPVLRRRFARWGATRAEAAGPMPGDRLVPAPKLSWTRAVTVRAAPESVWAWLAQIGQGRGGFYSYDALPNLLGCAIHSADRILPEHQRPAVGDLIRLAPGRAPCYRVAEVDPPRALVLLGADPVTRLPGPAPAARDLPGVTWAWSLRPVDGGRRTRLVVRERYSYPRRQAVLWHLVEPIDFAMERRMLRGIAARAERG